MNSSSIHRHSYVHGGSSEPFCYLTIDQFVEDLATQCPDSTAIVSYHQGIRKTYRQLANEVATVATGLRALGLEKGDRVAVWGRNSYEWILMALALARNGMITVSVCPAFKSEELSYALRKVRCKALFIQDDLDDTDYYGILSSLNPCIATESSCCDQLRPSVLPHLKYVILSGQEAKRGTIPFRLLTRPNSFPEDSPEQQNGDDGSGTNPDDIFCIHYTSGTTGQPKAAMITHFSLLNSAIFTIARLGLRETMVMCMQLPLYHIFGWIQTLGLFHTRGTMVLPSARFNARETIKSVHSERCNLIAGVETMFRRIVEKLSDFPSDALASLKIIKMGGAACTKEAINQLEKTLNSKIMMGYGITETTGTISTIDSTNDIHKTSETSCGTLQPYTELKIVDTKGDLLPLGEKGEIWVRGFQIFRGYWEDEEKTKEAKDQNGWYRTGDLGRLDQAGHLYIEGRLKNLIIRGGENIYPMEIEEIIGMHSDIKIVQVVGVRDAQLGEELCAVVQLREDSDLNGDRLKEYCKGKMAHFKVPKYYLFVDSFPRTPTGKIQKHRLTNQAEKLLGLVEDNNAEE